MRRLEGLSGPFSFRDLRKTSRFAKLC